MKLDIFYKHCENGTCPKFVELEIIRDANNQNNNQNIKLYREKIKKLPEVMIFKIEDKGTQRTLDYFLKYQLYFFFHNFDMKDIKIRFMNGINNVTYIKCKNVSLENGKNITLTNCTVSNFKGTMDFLHIDGDLQLPEDINANKIQFSYNNIVNVNFKNVNELIFAGCHDVKFLKKKYYNHITFNLCNIEKLPDNICCSSLCLYNMKILKEVNLYNNKKEKDMAVCWSIYIHECPKITKISKDIFINELILDKCYSIEELPNIKSKKINLYNCPKLSNISKIQCKYIHLIKCNNINYIPKNNYEFIELDESTIKKDLFFKKVDLLRLEKSSVKKIQANQIIRLDISESKIEDVVIYDINYISTDILSDWMLKIIDNKRLKSINFKTMEHLKHI